MSIAKPYSRRKFISRSSGLLSATALLESGVGRMLAQQVHLPTPKISAHLWVYASAHPPLWDATPDLERAFSDLQFSGFDGVELMAVNLKHDDSVERISALSKKYNMPITGTSYGAAMWDETKHDEIVREGTLVLQRLSQLGGETLGISVGDAKRTKTESELDAQAKVLKEILPLCAKYGVKPNLHNHIYEVANGMHDLKGTLARVPDIKLGPDLNWLVRGGVDPLTFINIYGSKMTYMHIRDQYADGTWTEYPGEGVTNFPAIAAALKAQHFQGRAAVELAFPTGFVPTHPLSVTWKLSRDYVRTVFGW